MTASDGVRNVYLTKKCDWDKNLFLLFVKNNSINCISTNDTTTSWNRCGIHCKEI